MKGNSREILNDYFLWLCEIVCVDQEEDSYWFLARTLHDEPYHWFVPNDDNRGMDGLKLREEFTDEISYYDSYTLIDNKPCTMLEMLIALARRVNDIMARPGEGDKTAKWFWELMENLEFDRYTDVDFLDLHGTVRVPHRIDIVLGRTYKRNGKGGIFPLKRAKKDQRKVEIWYQMCTYLIENYYVDGEII